MFKEIVNRGPAALDSKRIQIQIQISYWASPLMQLVVQTGKTPLHLLILSV